MMTQIHRESKFGYADWKRESKRNGFGRSSILVLTGEGLLLGCVIMARISLISSVRRLT